MLTFINVNKERVKVFFASSHEHLKDRQAGTLLDPAYLENDKEIEYGGDPLEGKVFISHTVTKEKALEVATYYLQHETLPRDLMWAGRMDDFVD